jgi:hypothetical protein
MSTTNILQHTSWLGTVTLIYMSNTNILQHTSWLGTVTLSLG